MVRPTPTPSQRTKHPRRSSSTAGFTLAEVVVVVAIIGIVAVVSVPNLRYQQAKNGATNAVNDVQSALWTARFEALKRHSQVVVAVDAGTRTVRVFEDRNRADDAAVGNGNGQLDANEQVLQAFSIDTAVRLDHPTGADPVDLGGDRLFFQPDGSLTRPLVADPAVYFSDVHNNRLRLRVNSVTGSASIEMLLRSGGWSNKKEAWQWAY